MGFLPFVNRGGRRIVRWPRLVLMWIALILACVLGCAAMSYALLGDWTEYVAMGVAIGVFFSVWVTVQGFRIPVENLPSIR